MRYRFGECVLDVSCREIKCSGENISVEPQVFDLITYLIEHRDRVISKDELIRSVWGGRVVSDAAVDSRIRASRRAIGDTGGRQNLIRTFPRKGVRFVGDIQPIDAPGEPPGAAVAAQSLPAIPSIAVSPFVNIDGGIGLNALSDGIADDLTTVLSRFRGLFVVSRNSPLAHKDQTIGAAESGVQPGVRYVLSGGVRQAGSRLRVSVQLTDAVLGKQVWAERYDGDLEDVFSFQDRITKAVVGWLIPVLEDAERARVIRISPGDLKAWECYLSGRLHLGHRDAAANETARAFFQRAIAQDDRLARAFSGLAFTYLRDVITGRLPPDEALAIAEPLATRAVWLDDMDATAHAVLGLVLLTIAGAHDLAEAEARRAWELTPDLGLANGALGALLTYAGKPSDGLVCLEKGFRLDPRNPFISFRAHFAHAHYFRRDYAAALEQIDFCQRAHEEYQSIRVLRAATLGQLGRTGEARRALEAGAVRGGQRPRWLREEDRDHLMDGLRKAGL